MARTLSDLFTDLARHASEFDEPLLAHICRIAALESRDKPVPAPYFSKKIVGIWDWDVVNDRNHLDPNCAALFGVDPSKAKKGLPNAAYLKAIHPDDVQAAAEAINRALIGGGPFEAEYRVVSDDRVRRVFAKGHCTLDRSNRPERFPGAMFELSTALQ